MQPCFLLIDIGQFTHVCPFGRWLWRGGTLMWLKKKRQEQCYFHRGTAFSTGSLGVCGPPCHQYHIVSSCFIFALKASACEAGESWPATDLAGAMHFTELLCEQGICSIWGEKMTRSWMFWASQTVEGFLFLITATEQNTVLQTFVWKVFFFGGGGWCLVIEKHLKRIFNHFYWLLSVICPNHVLWFT